MLASLAASVSAWANVNWVSKVPPGRSLCVVELARVGHPFVDQDQRRPILVEQFAQRLARAGRRARRPPDARRKAFPTAELPGELPHKVRTSVPSAFIAGFPARFVPDQHDAATPRAAGRSPRRLISSCTTPGSSSAAPDTRWYSASIECVLPPPKLVCSWMTGSPAIAAKAQRAHATSSLLRLSVR